MIQFPQSYFLTPKNLILVKMPLRTAAIRRCGFKLPNNDKYQCQKAGDKFQPVVDLWYCRLHDRHTQDRCQVLVRWAGKGAQCEQLGVLDKTSGRKLCDWHLSQANRDTWLEDETEHSDHSRPQSIERADVWQRAAKMDDTAPNQPMPLSESHPDGPGDADGLLSLTEVEPQRPLDSIEAAAGLGKSEQEQPTEEHFGNARISLSDSDSTAFQDEEEFSPSPTVHSAPTPASGNDAVEEDGTLIAPQTLDTDYRLSETATANPGLTLGPEAGCFDDAAASAAEEDDILTSSLASNVSKSAGRSHCTMTSSGKTVQETRSRGPVETPRNLGRVPHVRTDSLSPFAPILLAGGPEPDTPNTPTSNAALCPRNSTQSPRTAHGATIASPSIQARIAFLNALQDQGASVSNHMIAVYAQCCVCLEKHGEHNMREVATCKHRYRELCLKKATKAENLRSFNCSGCMTWMTAQKEDMPESGRL